MSYGGEKQDIIALAPGLAMTAPCTLEFIEAIKDFSPSDLFIVRRLLEQLRRIADHEGPDAALAAIDRASAKQRVPRAQ